MNAPPLVRRWLLPSLTWVERRFQPDLAVGLGDHGEIAAVCSADELPADADCERLDDLALLPGFVNAHSHAFQRAFRGQTEFLHVDRAEEDFWSWRQQMYGVAMTLTPESIYDVASALYAEARAAGFTAVGEFHYVHHRPDGTPYDPSTRLADAVIQAALDAGLRITLLSALYHTGGVAQPASPNQRRFIAASLDDYLAQTEALMHRWASHPRVNVGLAPHSIRAVPFEWLSALADWNRAHKLPVHMHLCEQPAEVAASHAHFGAAPVEVVANAGLLGPGFVAVHATHLAPQDPARLSDAGASVCACPTTEANLGDGFLPAEALLGAGVPLCIGTDSHAVVNPFEELRLIENNARLQRRRRNVLASLMPADPSEPTRRRVAPGLLDVGTVHGADALGVEAGVIAPGRLADLVAVDLRDPSLRGVPPQWLPEALVFSADTRCVRRTWVHGESSVL